MRVIVGRGAALARSRCTRAGRRHVDFGSILRRGALLFCTARRHASPRGSCVRVQAAARLFAPACTVVAHLGAMDALPHVAAAAVGLAGSPCIVQGGHSFVRVWASAMRRRCVCRVCRLCVFGGVRACAPSARCSAAQSDCQSKLWLGAARFNTSPLCFPEPWRHRARRSVAVRRPAHASRTATHTKLSRQHRHPPCQPRSSRSTPGAPHCEARPRVDSPSRTVWPPPRMARACARHRRHSFTPRHLIHSRTTHNRGAHCTHRNHS